MAFKFDEQLTIEEILEGPEQVIKDNFDLLEDDYIEKFGKKVKKGCSSCIREVVSALKKYYNMSQFRFKGATVHYKIKKGDKFTISNSTMTDEKAIAFLKVNPDRIRLFSEYPENWEELVKGKPEYTEEEKALISELEKMKLDELKELYPGIKVKSKKAFIKKVIELERD